MKPDITIVGPAWPYRGGIAAFNEKLAQTFAWRGHRVSVITFKRQYPSLLFPGRTQYTDSPAPGGMSITREIDSVNPLNWLSVGNKVKRSCPDLLIFKYWTPFMAPCLGTIARRASTNRHTVSVVSVDNIVPHEKMAFDKALNRYFTRSVDGFVYMSKEVGEQVHSFRPDAPSLFSPHPIYDLYGDKSDRLEAASRLGLDAGKRYLLFFGLVREYKGLDILLDAFAKVMSQRQADDLRLIVAGEFYSDKEKYTSQIARLRIDDKVIVHDRFIPDSDVKHYFSLADVLVQPYKTATQSGVTQIAYNFDLPMIVTNVGGLGEIVADGGSGFVVSPEADSVAQGIERVFCPGVLDELRRGVSIEKTRFSWDTTADAIIECYRMAKK